MRIGHKDVMLTMTIVLLITADTGLIIGVVVAVLLLLLLIIVIVIIVVVCRKR